MRKVIGPNALAKLIAARFGVEDLALYWIVDEQGTFGGVVIYDCPPEPLTTPGDRIQRPPDERSPASKTPADS